MKYFLDTEFHEYKKKPLFGKPIDTIELISIGIVSEDIYNPGGILSDYILSKITTDNSGNSHREYYAICKEFDLKAAWNNVWLRENVLKPIFFELAYDDFHLVNFKDTWLSDDKELAKNMFMSEPHLNSNFKWFKKLLNKYGKTKAQIAEEIEWFIRNGNHVNCSTSELVNDNTHLPVEFYAYYADYDWVVFCWLFGRMIDLPKRFPMYCNDLKQDFDFYNNNFKKRKKLDAVSGSMKRLNDYKEHPEYPKQTNEHNALADAKWNKELYKFIENL